MAVVLCCCDHRACCFCYLVTCFLFPEELGIVELCLATIECNFWCLEDFCIIELTSGTTEISFLFCGGLLYHRDAVPDVGSCMVIIESGVRKLCVFSWFLVIWGS